MASLRPALLAALVLVAAPPPSRDGRAAVGERLSYAVSFSGIPVGSADMTLVGADSVNGHRVMHAVLRISGGLPFFGVLDSASSWFDSATFVSRRFVQRIHEGRFVKDRDFEIDPERLVYRYGDRPAKATSANPLDDVS